MYTRYSCAVVQCRLTWIYCCASYTKSKEISLHENIKYLDYPRLTASIADNVSNIRALGC